MTVPSSVRSVGTEAFYGCVELRKVNVDVGDVDRMRAMMEAGGLDVAGVQFVEDRTKCRLIAPVEAVSIDLGLVGYTAKGLPSGLRYDKTTGMITGAATKPAAAEGVVVKFAKSGAETKEMTIAVGPLAKIEVALEGDTDGCKVTGAGVIIADFAPIVTVNKGKRVLSVHTNIRFDRSDEHAEGVGGAELAE